jgi:hypothetical protein
MTERPSGDSAVVVSTTPGPLAAGEVTRKGIKGRLEGEPATRLIQTLALAGAFCAPIATLAWSSGRILRPPPAYWWVGTVVLLGAVGAGSILTVILLKLWRPKPDQPTQWRQLVTKAIEMLERIATALEQMR